MYIASIVSLLGANVMAVERRAMILKLEEEGQDDYSTEIHIGTGRLMNERTLTMIFNVC